MIIKGLRVKTSDKGSQRPSDNPKFTPQFTPLPFNLHFYDIIPKNKGEISCQQDQE